FAAVQDTGFIVVLFDHRAIQFDTREDAASAGISQHLRLHLPVGAAFGLASDGTSRNRTFGTQLELAGQQVVHTFLVHNEHNQVDSFAAELQAPASTGDGERCGGAPAPSRPACGNATAITATNDESTLDHRRYDRHALGRSE